MELVFLIIIITLAIAIRLIAGSCDEERIRNHISEIGGELIDKKWDPFGPGWFGEKNARIYVITYKDSNANTHQAHVKTSMFSGVYLTNDHIIKAAPSPAPSLADEKTALKNRLAEIERMEQG